MQGSPLIATKEELDLAARDLARAIEPARRFPDSPFITPGYFSLCEYSSFTSLTFGRAISRLAAEYSDEWISGVVVDPAPETYFDEDHVYGAFRFDTREIPGRWSAALDYAPSGNGAATIQVQSMVLAVVGSSGRWSAWGERSDELAVVRTDGADVSWRGDEGPFVEPTEALRSFVQPNYRQGSLPNDYESRFLLNFRRGAALTD